MKNRGAEADQRVDVVGAEAEVECRGVTIEVEA